MNTQSLATALATLRRASTELGSRLSAGMILELGRLCLALFTALGRLVHCHHDPRLVLAHAKLVEQFAWLIHGEQLEVALDAELAGAHSLTLQEYDALAAGTTNFQSPAQRVRGRTCYKDTANLLAAWLNIDYHEAAGRIADAHRLVGRRTMEGTRCNPRFERLAGVYRDPSIDRRQVAQAARALDRLEAPDEIFNGVDTALTATAQDGLLLEEHAAAILRAEEQRTAKKKLGALVTEYREANGENIPPELGLFVRPTRHGVQEFVIRAVGADAERIRSLIAQADNWRTQAGTAARIAADGAAAQASGTGSAKDRGTTGKELDSGNQPAPSAPAGPSEAKGSAASPAATPANASTGADGAADPTPLVPDPDWLRTDQPPPQWAVDPDAGPPAASDPAQAPPAPAAAQTPEPDFTAPEVSAARRRLNALVALLSQSMDGTGKTKTVTPEVVVHLDYDSLLNLAQAKGVTAHGQRIGATELRLLLCQARLIPMMFNSLGQVLDVGRSQRLYNTVQRKIIIARDGGCIVPGCTVPPELVEAHHYEDGGWAGGCPTSVDKGAGACKGHHADVHAGLFKIIRYKGLPHVLYPKHIDPLQIPRRNTYWKAA